MIAALQLRRATFRFDRTYIAGVLNVTPDSFSDGGAFDSLESCVAHALKCVESGADLLDVGGESTRPGAASVLAAEEIRRVVPVVERLMGATTVPISVDTTKAEVAEAAVRAGAEIVNDISGGTFDPEIIDVCARTGAAFVCGHLRGKTIAEVHAAPAPTFEELCTELAARLAALPADLRQRTVVDPGLGFGKASASDNAAILRRLGELRAALGRPVMVGPSRKRFIGEILGRAVGERDDGTIGAALAAAAAGADFVRVHDVRRVRDALTVFERVMS
ncbi:MAG TPA: dihydropteroate synthase [Haliangiales bacterium]|nr:dihydropteroate synthase [Haliangiales bacterium]